jgi:hypothetical protein
MTTLLQRPIRAHRPHATLARHPGAATGCRTRWWHLSAAALLAALAACGGGGPAGREGEPASFTLSGSVEGLTTSGLVLQNNGAERVDVAANSSQFTFTARLASNGPYNVQVAVQPGVAGNAQDCTVSQGSGTATSHINTVRVSCGAMRELTLVQSDPPDNATQVSRAARLSLRFSSPLDPASPLASNLALVTFDGQGSAQRLPFSLTLDGPQVGLTPTTKLLPNAQHWMYGGVGVCGLRQECLPFVAVSRFTTGDNRWQGIQPVSSAQPPSSGGDDASTVALDDNGYALAAWIVQGDPALRVSHYDPVRGNWGGLQQVTAGPGQPVQVKLATDAAGNAVLVWALKGAEAPQGTVIWAARYKRATQTWDAPAAISHRDGSHADTLDLAVRPGGDIAVAWRRSEAAGAPVRDSVWLRTSTTAAGAAWLPDAAAGPLRMDDPDAAPGLVQVKTVSLAMAPQSQGTGTRLAVAWDLLLNDTVQGRTWARLASANGFLPARIVSDEATNREVFPRVVINPLGVATVVWLRLEGEHGSVWSRAYAFGEWGSSQRVSPATQNASTPRIAVSGHPLGDVRPWASWLDMSDAAAAQAWVARPGGSARTRLPVPLDAGRADGAVDLVLDRMGNALAVWPTQAAGRRTLTAARFNVLAEAWDATQATRVDAAHGPSRGTTGLSVNAQGDLLVTWCDRAPGTGDCTALAARRFD